MAGWSRIRARYRIRVCSRHISSNCSFSVSILSPHPEYSIYTLHLSFLLPLRVHVIQKWQGRPESCILYARIYLGAVIKTSSTEAVHNASHWLLQFRKSCRRSRLWAYSKCFCGSWVHRLRTSTRHGDWWDENWVGVDGRLVSFPDLDDIILRG